MSEKKYVYAFGEKITEGTKDMRDSLGGKGVGLAEMAGIGIPVPPGFTISTEVCVLYLEKGGQYPAELKKQVTEAMTKVETLVGKKFGDPKNPLLVSVRSGARKSMPGMMDTILNVGLSMATIPAMIEKTKNPRFVYDSYRRLIMMYSDVVMEKAAGIEPKAGKHPIREELEHIMKDMKAKKNVKDDTQLTADDLKQLAELFKAKVQEVLGKAFPDKPEDQLWGAIGGVFQSWNGKRAIEYRRIERIPDSWGTAVNVQSMVFGNMGDSSATGVAFTRNPATGENKFYGEWLVNAQGEDVVAGIRTPFAINEEGKSDANRNFTSLEKGMPDTYKQLLDIRKKLEANYKDMQDIEFTIQEGKLWMLQTRSGKRNGLAAVRTAVEMVDEKLIDKNTAIMRVEPKQLDELLHPMVDPKEEGKFKAVATGLPAGPGGATGKVVLTAEKAAQWAANKEKVILVRRETSAEDVGGMNVAEGILTATGGFTSHAAVVARGWGKCCIVGCGAIDIDLKKNEIHVADKVIKEGDVITLNGTSGKVYVGSMPLVVLDLEENKYLKTFLGWCDEVRKLGVRANGETPKMAKDARRFGAAGIGLARTERTFLEPESRILAMRVFLFAKTKEEREKAIDGLMPSQKQDFKEFFQTMAGFPVLIRLLDPPLHEFLPKLDDVKKIEDVSKATGKSVEEVKARIKELHEENPMLGRRGCRVGINFPEITRMQSRAIFEALAELKQAGVDAISEIMYPMIGNVKELKHQMAITREVAKEVEAKYNIKLNYSLGTMIEVPRAALTADEIAQEAEFFSFGTNDLTQMGGGFSRDDSNTFLPKYVEMGIYPVDPFSSLDQKGIGELVRIAVEKGRATRPGMKIGVCGEHGGDPASIEFFHKVGLTYVSCSPFRVPIARLAAAQAQIKYPREEKK